MMSREEAKADAEAHSRGETEILLTPDEEQSMVQQLVELYAEDQHEVYNAAGQLVAIISDPVHHPAHYGGGDNPYEAIKVIEAWGLDFCLGNTVKYISRAGKKDGNSELQDLKKALWYLERRITQLGRGEV